MLNYGFDNMIQLDCPQAAIRSSHARLHTSLKRKVAHVYRSRVCDYWLLVGLKGLIGRK